MWELQIASSDQEGYIKYLLERGYEPFAVVPDHPHNKLYFKKETHSPVGDMPPIQNLTPEMKKELLNEIHIQQPEPVKRASRRATRKSKG